MSESLEELYLYNNEIDDDSIDAFTEMLEGYTELEDWPHAGSVKGERIAASYFADVYESGQRAIVYSRQWRRGHSLLDCKASEAHELCAGRIADGEGGHDHHPAHHDPDVAAHR